MSLLANQKQNNEHRHADRGVSFAKGRWRAYVNHNYRRHHVGYFATREEALQAAAALRRELFTHNDEDRGEQGE